MTQQFIGAEFIPLFSRRNKKNTAGDKAIQRGGIHSALLQSAQTKRTPHPNQFMKAYMEKEIKRLKLRYKERLVDSGTKESEASVTADSDNRGLLELFYEWQLEDKKNKKK